MQALQSNDFATADHILKSSPHLINELSYNGETPLMEFISNSDYTITNWLLANGADVDAPDRNGNTVCEMAIDGDYTNAGESEPPLLRRSKLLSQVCADGMTLLEHAIERDNLPVVRYLIDIGANVKVRDLEGNTALHIASERSSIDIVRLLLDHGADIDAQNNRGQTPIEIALNGTFISPSVIADQRRYDGPPQASVMSIAGEPNNEVAMTTTLLINRGAKTQVKDLYGLTTYLYTAINHDRLDLYLLTPGTSSFSKLIAAIVIDDAQTARQLIRDRRDLATDRLSIGATAIDFAALWNARNCAKLLIQAGANIDDRDAYAQTPLHYACRSDGNDRMIDFLVNHGAAIDALDARDATPLDIAVESDSLGNTNCLIKHKVNVNAYSPSVEPAIELVNPYDGEQIAAALLNAGANMKMENKLGDFTLLQSAVNSRSLPFVALLVKYGVNINGVTPYNSSPPLLIAVRNESVDIASFLIDNGADINLRNRDSESPLSTAMADKGDHGKEIVALLLAHHAAQPLTQIRGYFQDDTHPNGIPLVGQASVRF